MEPHFLSDEERRSILAGRLQSLEREHYEQELNRAVGEELSRSGVGDTAQEARAMLAEAERIQAVVVATHDLLTQRLRALDGQGDSAGEGNGDAG